MAVDINDLGSFSSIDAVWARYPEGGHEGDYLTIGGVKYRWNKYLRIWENASTVTQSPARLVTTIGGDLTVNNDTIIGDELKVRGDTYLEGDVKVEGMLDTKAVKQPNRGFFQTAQALQDAYPSPEVGWWATVGDVMPGTVYRCQTEGVWTNTGQTGGVDTERVYFEIEDTCTSISTDKALSANQGKQLKMMIDSLKLSGYMFAGIATPESVIETPDEKVFYIGTEGIYGNFGSPTFFVMHGDIAIFCYNGTAWTRQYLNISTTSYILAGCKENIYDKTYVRKGIGIQNIDVDNHGELGYNADDCTTGYYKIPEYATIMHIKGGLNVDAPLKIRYVSTPVDDIANASGTENVFIQPYNGSVDVDLKTFRAAHPNLKYFCVNVYRNNQTAALDDFSIIFEDNKLGAFNLYEAVSPSGTTRATFPKYTDKDKDYYMYIKADIANMTGSYNVIGRYNDDPSTQVIIARIYDNELHEIAVTEEYDYFQTYYDVSYDEYRVYVTYSGIDYEFNQRINVLETLMGIEWNEITFSGSYTTISNEGNEGKMLICYMDSDATDHLDIMGRDEDDVDSYIGMIHSGYASFLMIEDDTYVSLLFTNATAGVKLKYKFIERNALYVDVLSSIGNIFDNVGVMQTGTFSSNYRGFPVSGVQGKYVVGYYSSNTVRNITVIGVRRINGAMEQTTLGVIESGKPYAFALDKSYSQIYFNKGTNTDEVTVTYKITSDEMLLHIIEAIQDSSGGGAEKPTVRLLAIGDSFTAPYQRWLSTAMTYFSSESSVVDLAVIGATIRDNYQDRETYPYTSRPNKDVNTGNLNTFGCQIAKLERLMAGIDLDQGEQQIYTDPSQYPNVIVIAGGMNDAYKVQDTDAEVANYSSQLIKQVTAYYTDSVGGTPVLGSCYIKTPLSEIDRTTYAGAYRYLIESVLTLFPQAQVFITTIAPLNKYSRDFVKITHEVAEKQRICADLFSATVIDWHQDVQSNIVNNYPSGSGTQADPYIFNDIIDSHGGKDYVDIGDYIHPVASAGKKYGHIAGKRIAEMFIDIAGL